MKFQNWAGPTVGPMLVALGLASPLPVMAESVVESAVYAAWKAMRQLDCARCHGRDYTGSVGPSLIESARTRSEEEFVRLVLQGNVVRGMPPYAGVKLAADTVRGMYVYFKGRAEGSIPVGTLSPPAPAQQ